MDLRFVETLVVTVEAGGMAAAARRLGITAAAVSQRIDALEAELRVPLLQRAGRTMQATAQGEALLPELRRLLQLREGLQQVLAQDQLVGPLRVGAISTALAEHAAPLVAGLAKAAPEATLTLVPGASAALYDTFVDGGLDAVILVAPPFELPKTMRFEVLSTQPIGLLEPGEAPKRGPLPYLIYDRAAWGGLACYRVLEKQVPNPDILCEMDALETIAQMVAQGVAQSVVPYWPGIDPFGTALRFSPLPHDHGPQWRQVGLLCWQRDYGRPVQQVLRQALGLSAG